MDPTLAALLTSLQQSVSSLSLRFDALEASSASSRTDPSPPSPDSSPTSPIISSPIDARAPSTSLASQAPASTEPPSAEFLLSRTLLTSVLSRLEPLFDPLAPPDDAILRANAWFIPWLRANVLFYYDNDLTDEEAATLWVHPFQRLLAVHASYRIPAPFAAIDKLEDKFVEAARELILKLLAAIHATFATGLPLAPLHSFFSAAVTSLRTQFPFLAERRRVNDRPARFYPASQPTSSADPASSDSAPPASSHANVPARAKGRKGL